MGREKVHRDEHAVECVAHIQKAEAEAEIVKAIAEACAVQFEKEAQLAKGKAELEHR